MPTTYNHYVGALPMPSKNEMLRIQEPSQGTHTPSYFSPVPVATALKGGTTGAAYTETISAQNGTPSYTFAVTSGSLPTGTSLNGSTGVISGTPSAAGAYSFTVTVTDAGAFTGSQAFSITVASPLNSGFVS